MRRLSLATLLVLAVCLAPSANAVTLNVVGGQLLGASNVLVDGDIYDVEFVDGTCIALFDGCNSPSDFAFTNSGSAALAAQALLDQVFVDGGAGQFDPDPALTTGCTNSSFCRPFVSFGSIAILAIIEAPITQASKVAIQSSLVASICFKTPQV